MQALPQMVAAAGADRAAAAVAAAGAGDERALVHLRNEQQHECNGISMEVIAVIVFFAVMLVMATLGAILLVLFARPAASTRVRTLWAALLGPGLACTPLILVMAADGREFVVVGLAAASILLAGVAIVGWPVLHFATRRLDKLTRFDVSTFQ